MDCLLKMKKETNLFPDKLPILNQVAAVSVGVRNNQILLDLNYEEDSTAQADANFVFTSAFEVVEIQGTAEQNPFKTEQFLQMMNFAQEGIKTLCNLQNLESRLITAHPRNINPKIKLPVFFSFIHSLPNHAFSNHFIRVELGQIINKLPKILLPKLPL